ncbi:GSU3473 family protein [Geobacter sp. DSM 9736]|uniref:GSU3473 family protein n=1 Tax=Geobacter sp. DSM 9736 TaxID=1277350 RepID=UPI000B513C8E|nr:hypothetical protein [Geobacter sp. DSM 9736]SNB45403.1 hypothetical protein SAMN06269301_0816 [Geobacter sp. DSM 9736]
MMIRVIYNDQSAGMVADYQLDDLINAGKIVAFHRTDGWVSVEQGPLRGRGEAPGSYEGPERRRKNTKSCKVKIAEKQ